MTIFINQEPMLPLQDRQGNPIPNSFPKEALEMYGARQIEQVTEQSELKDHPVHSTGAKREKLNGYRYDYMPAREVNEAYASIATMGARKYSTDNWMKGLPISQLSASMQRHLWAYMSGEDKDPESGLSHLSHVLWNAVAMVYFESKGVMDDRFEERLQSQHKSLDIA